MLLSPFISPELPSKLSWQRICLQCRRSEFDYWVGKIHSWRGQFSSVQFSRPVMSDTLRPHESQHARPPCPSPTPGVYSNSCPWSWWCHPTISSSVIPFSYPQSFPASGSFQISQLFVSGSQSIGVSASTSVLAMNTQDWSPLEWTLGSPCSPRESQEFSPTLQFKSINSSALSFLYSPTLTSIRDYCHKFKMVFFYMAK